LNNSGLGDLAMVELAGGIGLGRLPRLEFLDANSNRVGDEGMAALARAAAELPRLRTLYLDNNAIGSAGATSLAAAVAREPCVLGQLEKLGLSNNRISDVGVMGPPRESASGPEGLFCTQNPDGKFSGAQVLALDGALAAGALPRLELLQLEGNPAGANVQQAAVEALKGRSTE
jgi:hypothetical protein